MRRFRTGIIVTVAMTLSVAGCGGSSPSHPAMPASTTVATRWWQDDAAAVGSTINPNNPTAAARKLHPDRQSYCTILSETVSAGHNILAGVSATDPATLVTVTAWLAELQAVAPTQLDAAWHTMSSAITTLIGSHGSATSPLVPAGMTAAQISQASQTIAADAKSSCGLTLAAGK